MKNSKKRTSANNASFQNFQANKMSREAMKQTKGGGENVVMIIIQDVINE